MSRVQGTYLVLAPFSLIGALAEAKALPPPRTHESAGSLTTHR